jgi:hypothetical protein
MRKSGFAGSVRGLAAIVGLRVREQRFATDFRPQWPGETQNFKAE